MNGFLKINDVLDAYYAYMAPFDILWYFSFLSVEIRTKFALYRCIVMYINTNYDWVYVKKIIEWVLLISYWKILHLPGTISAAEL